MNGAGRQLALATVAFTVCFYGWSILGPLSPDLQDDLGLSDFQSSAMVAVPVLLGSIMRIPLGWLTDRLGGRAVFTALLAYTPLPLIALELWHDYLSRVK
jgi:NNP family nitrate/nitrite transporter-like MFS transporter